MQGNGNRWAIELPMGLLAAVLEFVDDGKTLALATRRVCRSWSQLPPSAEERLWSRLTLRLTLRLLTADSWGPGQLPSLQPDPSKAWRAAY